MDKRIYKAPWFVYIAECRDKTLYVGIAIDAEKRVKEHNATSRCKYTRSRKPIKLVYKEICLNHNQAWKRERKIRSFTREKKLELIS